MTHIVDSILYIKSYVRKIQTIIQGDIFMLKLKKLKKYVALGLSCLIAINTTTVTFAQNSTSTQKYKSANNEISNNIIIKNSGVIINGTYYSIAEFESLLDHAILISETGNSSARICCYWCWHIFYSWHR